MAGRPKKTNEEKRTNFINVRLNNSEKEKLKFLSEKQGISKHQVIRNGIELQYKEEKMNRKIKFRSWCETYTGTSGIKKFMENCFKQIKLEPTSINPQGSFIGKLGIWCGLHESVFMQYIGIEDKNKKEIYESDIVKIDGKRELFTVVWVCDTARFGLQSKEELLYFEFGIGSRIEVVGNKYENPELL